MEAGTVLPPHAPQLPAAAVANIAVLLSGLVDAAPGASLHEHPDVFLTDSGVPDATFNVICGARFAADRIEGRVAETLRQARATGRPFTWWVEPDAPADLARRLEAAGLKEPSRAPFMVADLAETAAFDTDVPEGLTIREPADETELADFGELLACSADPRLENVARFFGSAIPAIGAALRGETPDAPILRTRMLIGYLDGRPACTSHVVLAGGVAGLYNIATHRVFRRRGLGTAMTLAAMRAAREHGYRTALLQASEMGEPVYRRIGYRADGEFLLYAVEP